MGTLEDEQNGFCKDRSCLHHIFVLTSIVRNECSCKNGQVLATFVDFRRAFDYTDRELLFFRLYEYGVTGRMLAILRQMYTHSMNAVRVNGVLSEMFQSHKGVKQGNNISPMCFSTFINDLLRALNKCDLGIKIDEFTKVCALAYADDIVLLASSATEMQKLLSILNKWCKN